MSDPDFVPFQLPAASEVSPLMVEPTDPLNADRIEVNTFDPEKRAEKLAVELPRLWTGTLMRARSGERYPVELKLDRLVPLGVMLDLFGTLTINGKSVPVQGNVDMGSDQLVLLPLGDTLPAGLEAGGNFLGLQMFALSSWVGPRLISRGAVLQLSPVQETAAQPPVRGLW